VARPSGRSRSSKVGRRAIVGMWVGNLIREQYRKGVTGPWRNLHKDYLYEDDRSWS
jgi:hypothetical protein